MLFNRALRTFDRLPGSTNFTPSQHSRPLPLLWSVHRGSKGRGRNGTSGDGEDGALRKITGKVAVTSFRPYVTHFSLSRLNPGKPPCIDGR